MRPERVFVLVAIVGGLTVLLVLPPFQAPDEPAHLFRAFAVSEGRLVGTWHERRVGAFVPSSFLPLVHVAEGIPFHPEKRQDPRAVRALFQRPLAPRERVFVDAPNTVLWSPVPYVPQALGIGLARALSLPAVSLFYAARLLNLACWIGLMAAAVRATPVRKWLFVALALAPMSLQQGASLSSDALTNAACFLFVALCLQARFAERVLTAREVTGLAVLAVVIALCKLVYVLVPLTVLLVPEARFGSARRRWSSVGAVLGLAAAASLAWGFAARASYATYDAYPAGHRDWVALTPGVEPVRQAAFILADPVRFAGALGAALWQAGEFVLRSFVGLLGWGETSLSAGHVPAYLALLLLLALVDHTTLALTGRERAGLALLALGSLLFVATGLYLHWTPVGAARVNGLHGRYMIPFGPLAFLVLQNGRLCVPPRVLAVGAALGVSVSTGAMIATLLARYY